MEQASIRGGHTGHKDVQQLFVYVLANSSRNVSVRHRSGWRRGVEVLSSDH